MKVQEDKLTTALIVLPTEAEVDEMLASIAWPCVGRAVTPPTDRELASARQRASAILELQRLADEQDEFYRLWEPYDLPDRHLERVVYDRMTPERLSNPQALRGYTMNRKAARRALSQALGVSV